MSTPRARTAVRALCCYRAGSPNSRRLDACTRRCVGFAVRLVIRCRRTCDSPLSRRLAPARRRAPIRLLVVRPPEGVEQALEGHEITFVGRGSQRLFHAMVAGDDVGIDAAHCLGALESRQFPRHALRRSLLAGTARPPARQPRIGCARVGKQRAQRCFVAGSGVGQPPPSEREIHPLGMKQGQPVLGQRGIGCRRPLRLGAARAWRAVRAAGACGTAPETRR